MSEESRIAELVALWDAAEDKQPVDELCREHPQLKAEVQRRIRKLQRFRRFHERTDSSLRSTDQIPTAIGPHKILRMIGEGGMGVVYVAEQACTNRPVAIKVMRSNFVSAEMRARFERECKLLARVNHPGIVAIYDSGIVPNGSSGLPFLVMEHVTGLRLDQYLREVRPSLPEQIRLLIKISEAVAYAHRMHIVHRDLKPSNILVTPSGEPKIVDFGIGRLLDSPEHESTSQTNTGQRIGTMQYMSPEQARGQRDVGYPADVYALGLIAYEMLAGARAYELGLKSEIEAGRIVQELEPSRLGTRVRALRGDLETIVARAMAKEPSRRYPTAEALAADLHRYQESRPILARPDTRWYRLRKFSQRNRAMVAATACVLVALLIGLALTSWQAIRATRAERRAESLLSERNAQLAESYVKNGWREWTEQDPAAAALWFIKAAKLRGSDSESADADRLRIASMLALAARPASVKTGDEATMTVTQAPARIEVSNDRANNRYELKLTSRGQDNPLVLVMPETDPPAAISSAELSKDESKLLVATKGHAAFAFDARSGVRIGPALVHELQVETARFSPDGIRAVTAGWDGNIRIWDVSSDMRMLHNIKRPEPVLHAGFSPDGSLVATGGQKGEIVILNARTGDVMREPFRHGSAVVHVEFNRDGTELLTCGEDGSVRRWHTRSGEQSKPVIRLAEMPLAAHYLNDDHGVETISMPRTLVGAIHPNFVVADGRKVVQGQAISRIVWVDGMWPQRLQSVEYGEPVFAHQRYVEGQPHAVLLRDGTLKRVDLPSLAVDDSTDLRSYVPSSGPRMFLGPNYALFQHDVSTWLQVDLANPMQIRARLCYDDRVEHVDASRDAESYLLVLRDSGVAVWDVASASERFRITDATIRNANFDPSGRFLSMDGNDGRVRWVDARTGTVISDQKLHRSRVGRSRLSPDGQRSLSTSFDGTAAVSSFSGDGPISTYTHGRPLSSATWSPDGKWIASFDEGGVLAIWDAQSGKARFSPIAHDREVHQAAFLNRGTLIACFDDKALFIYDSSTGERAASPIPSLPEQFAIFPLAERGILMLGQQSLARVDLPIPDSSFDIAQIDAELLACRVTDERSESFMTTANWVTGLRAHVSAADRK